MLYTSGRVWHEDLGDVRAPELADRCPLWLARYPFAGDQAPILDAMRVLDANKAHPVTVPPQLGDRGDWVIHQFQGNAVRCPGLAHGRVDVNRFNVARPGDTGDRVTWVQRKLKLPETSGTLDVETAAALRTFQAERGLAADAVVGPRTFAALAWA